MKIDKKILKEQDRQDRWCEDSKHIPFPGDICPYCNPITHDTKIFKHPTIVGWYCFDCHDVLDGNYIDIQAEDRILDAKEEIGYLQRTGNFESLCKKDSIYFHIDSNKQCKELTSLRKCGRCRNAKVCLCPKHT